MHVFLAKRTTRAHRQTRMFCNYGSNTTHTVLSTWRVCLCVATSNATCVTTPLPSDKSLCCADNIRAHHVRYTHPLAHRGHPLHLCSLPHTSHTCSCTHACPRPQFYWSLSTMSTIAYGDIVPRSSVERLFACFVMITGTSMCTSASCTKKVHTSRHFKGPSRGLSRPVCHWRRARASCVFTSASCTG